MTLPDHDLKTLLQEARTIAVVGHSDKPHRTSYQIAKVMRELGYKIYPVNPTVETIDGHISYPSLHEVPEHIDIVNVFRRSKFLPGVVEQAADVGADAVWAQLGVFHPQAAQKARAAQIPLVMDRCIKVEYFRLLR